MSSFKTPDIGEVKRCLKDAGLYEENMDDDDMRNYYDVIKSSESTAEEEIHNRTSDKCVVLEGKSEDKTQMEVDEITLSQIPIDIEVMENKRDSNKQHNRKRTESPNSSYEKTLNFDPLDCLPIPHEPLDIIYHDPKYRLPPHIDPALEVTPLEKQKLISAFHKNILDRFYEEHKKSVITVPLGRPICSSDKFNGSLDRKVYNECNLSLIDEESPEESIYTLRSGRQTKRKVYNESIGSDKECKRSKKDEEKENDLFKPSVPKRHGLQKLDNEDIMKRSKLFADTPTRAERLFDQLNAIDKKKQLDEEKINKFKHSLSGNEDDGVTASPVENKDDCLCIEDVKPKELPQYLRRRVPPPLRGRKGIGTRRGCASGSSEQDKSKFSENDSIPSPQNSEADKAKPKAAISVSQINSSAKQKSTKGKTQCPICSELFHRDEIEGHASNCGVGMETATGFESIMDSNGKTIKCDICEKEMPSDNNYEAHVNECLTKNRAK